MKSISLVLLVGCTKQDGLKMDLKHLIETSYKKPGGNCKELGQVSGFSLDNAGFTRSYKKSLQAILEQTHAAGGNFVFIKRASLDGTNLDGVSYSCTVAKKEE